LCANWQSALGSINKLVGMTSTAEPGKVYYFEVKPVMRPVSRNELVSDRYRLGTLFSDEAGFVPALGSVAAGAAEVMALSGLSR
jgi:hypothetical protein